MTSDDQNIIDQAIFGYSNGHRLLQTSVPMSPVDTYDLAAASDLAPGVAISGSASYLSGFRLPESGSFALMRTWLAPEMPRPGCVWTHVLILKSSVLNTQIDLSVLQELFRRPGNHDQDQTFLQPLLVNRREKRHSAREGAVSQILKATYCDQKAIMGEFSEREIEQAIFDVWSQQWPNLRSFYTFRSRFTSSPLKNQAFEFDIDNNTAAESSPSWIEVVAEDAVASTVTPLRRYLWRYGKDIEPTRSAFVDLMSFYRLLTTAKPTVAASAALFNTFGPGQATTLKRDVLGISASRASTIPTLAASDVIRFVGQHQPLSDPALPQAELVTYVSSLEPGLLNEVAVALDSEWDRLPDNLSAVLFDRAISGISDDLFRLHQISTEMAIKVLSARADLISPETLATISRADLIELLERSQDERVSLIILEALFRHGFDGVNLAWLHHNIETVFLVAISLHARSKFNSSWRVLFEAHAPELVASVPKIENFSELFAAADILRFPFETSMAPRIWADAFFRLRSQGDGPADGIFSAYIFALCLKFGIENFADVLVQVLPGLRSMVLHNELPSNARGILLPWLPDYKDGWDINRRILKAIRHKYKDGHVMAEVVASLNLTDQEYAYATNQDPDNMIRQAVRAFFWYLH